MEIETLEMIGQNVLATERGSGSGRASEVGGKIPFTTIYRFDGRRISRIQVFLSREEALEVGLAR